jgi:3-isopropylmalate/(R)-2-methylmalate dehydratase small subunit
MTGKVVKKFEDDTSTDAIYPGRYMATVLPAETPQFAFADDTAFNEMLTKRQILKGSIVLAGKNFGCGSSREQAVSAIHGHGLIVIAKGIARIFLQNAINVGLPVVICPDIEANEGDILTIKNQAVVNELTGMKYAITPLSETQKAVMEAGGLIAYTRTHLLMKAWNTHDREEETWITQHTIE